MSDWPHSPVHRMDSAGAYMVTAATYRKQHIFTSRSRLDLLLTNFQALTAEHRLAIQAWALFPNHYHLIAFAQLPANLRQFIQQFHSLTARNVNRLDRTPGRKVWFQYWDSRLTFQKSYFARLHYVHENPVHHRIVRRASNYPWCSAGWFERKASAAFRKVVLNFPCDKLHIIDDFEVRISDFIAQ